MSAPHTGYSSSPSQLATGWGRGSSSASQFRRVCDQDELERAISDAASSTRSTLARGLGRSYGDAAQCQGGTLIDTTALDRVITADYDTGRISVEAGLSIDQLLRLTVPRGWFVPVTPGTRQVTIGGAIAADVHGKNHHRDGAFGTYLSQLSLVTGRGRLELDPMEHPEHFWATVGGMGLTGVIASATIQLVPIETVMMSVDTDCTSDLEATMAVLADGDERYRYSVAWIDCAARGRRLGRSVLTRGDHASRSELNGRQRRQALDYRPSHTRVNLPIAPPFNVVIHPAITIANELYYRRAPNQRVGELQSIASFFYPLDAIGNWNRLYGPRGFTQYQFVVPFEAGETIRKAIEHLQAARVVPTLAVLKRFGSSDLAPLSFPMPGWTVALDLPLDNGAVGTALDALDAIIADAGGRVYLAKDGRLRPELLRTMYPRLEEWKTTRRQIDPEGIFVSDLSRRLGVN